MGKVPKAPKLINLLMHGISSFLSLRGEDGGWKLAVKKAWCRLDLVRMQFMHATVQAVPVCGSDGSSGEWGFVCLFTLFTERHGS